MATKLFLDSLRPAFSSANTVRALSQKVSMEKRTQSAVSNAMGMVNSAGIRSRFADNTKVAEELCEKGLEMLDTQQYNKALDLFKRANALNPNPNYEHFINMANSNGSFPSF